MSCPWCDGACGGGDLTPLLHANLQWLWSQLGQAADRRGDADLRTGTITIRAPDAAEERAMAVGLLGGQTLRQGQTRRLDLAALTAKLAARGPHLTPGAVTAHALKKRLATASRDRAARTDALTALHHQFDELSAGLPSHIHDRIAPDHAWGRLQRTGWLARIINEPDPSGLLRSAFDVLASLPTSDKRVDRRTLMPGDPHLLDPGRPLGSLVLALANAAGPDRTNREAWDLLGVDCDDLLGGLIALGLRPEGWTLPADAVITLPPRELARITWQPPTSQDSWAFVTENPSVLSAAAELAARAQGPGLDGTVHLLCTAGTPSSLETAAVGALGDAGWRVAIRADFDPAGLAHMRALLAAAPAATPWRMATSDYLSSRHAPYNGIEVQADETPWDAQLAAHMTASGSPAYEEALLPTLLDDLRAGLPGG